MDQPPKYLSTSFWRPTRVLKRGVTEQAPGSSAQRNLEVTAQAMALTRARTAPGKPGGTGTGTGALEGSDTTNMHQDCLAEGCDGGEPPWHNMQHPDVYIPCAWAVPRAPEHLQQELGTSRVLHSHVRAIRQGNHHVHQ